MRKLIKSILIAVFGCFLIGCSPPAGSISGKHEDLEASFRVIILDGCEYYEATTGHRAKLAHKGNCKNHIHK